MGRGTSGEVYLCSNGKYAVKRRPHGSSCFSEEQCLGLLAACPYVCSLVHCKHCTGDGHCYFWFDYHPTTLGTILPSGYLVGGLLAHRLARLVVAQLVLGLYHAHMKHVSHLDVKPENVLLTRAIRREPRGDQAPADDLSSFEKCACAQAEHYPGAGLCGACARFARQPLVKLTDFGISVIHKSDDDSVRTTRTTPLFMSPECMNVRGASGAAADVWSVGVLAHALLTGVTPAHSHDRETPLTMQSVSSLIKSTVPFVIPRGAGVPALACRFVERCLAKSVLDRPSVAELLLDPWVAPVVATLEPALLVPSGAPKRQRSMLAGLTRLAVGAAVRNVDRFVSPVDHDPSGGKTELVDASQVALAIHGTSAEEYNTGCVGGASGAVDAVVLDLSLIHI